MRTIYIPLFIFSILFCRSGNAQSNQATVDGTIVDSATGEAISFSSVAVYQKINNKDSLVNGVQANVSGQFTILQLPKGSFIVRVSFMGYKTLDQTITVTNAETLHLGTISLAPDVRMLEEVQVVGEKADLQITPEKRIFNVGKNMTSVGGTAESLLRK